MFAHIAVAGIARHFRDLPSSSNFGHCEAKSLYHLGIGVDVRSWYRYWKNLAGSLSADAMDLKLNWSAKPKCISHWLNACKRFCSWINCFNCNDGSRTRRQARPVGSYPKGVSPYGCMDMSGNVSELCSDYCVADYYRKSPLKNPKGPSKGAMYIMRGGSSKSPESERPGASTAISSVIIWRSYRETSIFCVRCRIVRLLSLCSTLLEPRCEAPEYIHLTHLLSYT